MSDIGNTVRLWVVNRHDTFLVLAPGPTGMPEPVEPSPILHNVAYVSTYEATGDLRASSAHMNGPNVTLLAKLPGPDGPPAQTAVLFAHHVDEIISYGVNGRAFQGIPAKQYRAAGPSQGYVWESDILQGAPGYFLVGSAQVSNLWRVTRVEVDHAKRYNFALVPVRLPLGLPVADFTAITDTTVRQEIQQHWSELQDAIVRHRYYNVVTSAKNAAECLLYHALLIDGHTSAGNRNLAELLKKLESVLADANSKATVPLDALALHLIHKMRILHGRTHVGRVVSDGRAIAPNWR